MILDLVFILSKFFFVLLMSLVMLYVFRAISLTAQKKPFKQGEKYPFYGLKVRVTAAPFVFPSVSSSFLLHSVSLTLLKESK